MVTSYCVKSAKPEPFPSMVWVRTGQKRNLLKIQKVEERPKPSLRKGWLRARHCCGSCHALCHVSAGSARWHRAISRPQFFQLLPDFLQLLHGEAHQLFYRHPQHQSRKLGSSQRPPWVPVRDDTSSSSSSWVSCCLWPSMSHALLPILTSQLTWAQHSATNAAYSCNNFPNSHYRITSNPYKKSFSSFSGVLHRSHPSWHTCMTNYTEIN